MPERKVMDDYATKKLPDNVFDPRVVQEIHRNADTDTDKTSVHHTIGPNANQVSSGVHTHDGTETRQLGLGITISGSKGGNAALASVIAAMVQILGVTDSST